jgi:guanine nucleotide-binding protein subunit beta-2-like 1 protein
MSAICQSTLIGHNGWVTSVAFRNNVLVTASRDKSLLIWDILESGEEFARPKRRLTGHSHFIQELALSVDGQFALTSSWDGTSRLWNLVKGVSIKRFVSHTKDVLSVAFSADNRQIISGARDNTVKVWNTLGEMKISLSNHSDWVSCVRYSAGATPYIISGSWDKTIRVFDPTDFTKEAFVLQNGAAVTCLDVAPDGSLCASGDKSGKIRLWDLNDGRITEEQDAGECVNALCFSPKNYWLCAATRKGIKIWDLEKNVMIFELNSKYENFDLKPRNPNPECLSLCWSENGEQLFAGYTDSCLRVWKFE